MRTHFYVSKTNRPKTNIAHTHTETHGKCVNLMEQTTNFSSSGWLADSSSLLFASHSKHILSVATNDTLSWCEFIILESENVIQPCERIKAMVFLWIFGSRDMKERRERKKERKQLVFQEKYKTKRQMSFIVTQTWGLKYSIPFSRL